MTSTHHRARGWACALLAAMALSRLAAATDVDCGRRVVPRRALDFYRDARRLAAARAHGRTCECDASFDAILTRLAEAAARDRRLKRRALADPAFAELRATVFFQLWSGHSLGTDAGLRRLLPTVRWDSTQITADRAAGGPLKLREDGSATAVGLDVERWSVKDLRLHLRVRTADGARDVVYELDFARTATLRLVGGDVAGALPFRDAPDECNL